LAQRCWSSCSVTCAFCDSLQPPGHCTPALTLCCLHFRVAALRPSRLSTGRRATRQPRHRDVRHGRRQLARHAPRHAAGPAHLEGRPRRPGSAALHPHPPASPSLWRSSARPEPAVAAYKTAGRRRAGGAPGPGSGRTVGRRRAGCAHGPGGLHAAPGRRAAAVCGRGLHGERRRPGDVCQARLPAPCLHAHASRSVWSSW